MRESEPAPPDYKAALESGYNIRQEMIVNGKQNERDNDRRQAAPFFNRQPPRVAFSRFGQRGVLPTAIYVLFHFHQGLQFRRQSIFHFGRGNPGRNKWRLPHFLEDLQSALGRK